MLAASLRPGAVLARAAEVAMVALGLTYVLVADDTAAAGLSWLAWFDLVAVLYLAVGFVVVRRAALRSRRDDAARRDAGGRHRLLAQRAAFAVTVTASLTGVAASVAVIDGQDDPVYGPAATSLGVLAVTCAWLLLQVGYARYYARLYERPDDLGGGLVFPSRPHPTTVDFLYFSFTLGVSFAASDVEVVHPRWRWHVLVHVVLSFAYNAVVLAIAISVVTGR